jgi:hypothetical protein
VAVQRCRCVHESTLARGSSGGLTSEVGNCWGEIINGHSALLRHMLVERTAEKHHFFQTDYIPPDTSGIHQHASTLYHNDSFMLTYSAGPPASRWQQSCRAKPHPSLPTLQEDHYVLLVHLILASTHHPLSHGLMECGHCSLENCLNRSRTGLMLFYWTPSSVCRAAAPCVSTPADFPSPAGSMRWLLTSRQIPT